MTNFILLIGAGLFTKAVFAFQSNAYVRIRMLNVTIALIILRVKSKSSFNKLLGADVDDAGGDGPGSYDVRGNIWHLDCCNPESKFASQGWTIFNAFFGWTNTGTSQYNLLTMSFVGRPLIDLFHSR